MKVLPRVLFLLKYRHGYTYGDYSTSLASGLFNSATYVSDMLKTKHYDSHVVEVTDNNCIDREVTKYNPQIVILEALWVVPEKLAVLKKLHPTVKWVVRLHSEIPFLSNEGIAIDWIRRYLMQSNVYVAFNSRETLYEFKDYFVADYTGLEHALIHLPNYYPVRRSTPAPRPIGKVLDVGCFGSLRPMKNQLISAFAAIEYARRNNLKLRFHVNSTRKDGPYMEPILSNLRALFDWMQMDRYTLVEHDWLDRPEFLQLVRTMDIGLQVSMSESFNIVSADFVSEGIPLVVSKEVKWMPKKFQADVNSVESIVKAMHRAVTTHHSRWFPSGAREQLEKVVKENSEIWVQELFRLITPE